MKSSTILLFVVSAFAIAVLAIIVLMAISGGAGMLFALLFGVVALAGIGAALTAFSIRIYERWSIIRAESFKARDDHEYRMAQQGLILTDGRFQPRAQIAAPEQKSEGQKGSQIILNPNALRESTVNLLLYSMQLIGEDQNRIASGPECAAGRVNGYTPRTWSKIVHEYLEPNFGVVTVRGPVENGGGTFVPDKYGTVGALYHDVMTQDAIRAMPARTP